MCGFVFTSDPSISKSAFLQALDLIRHRGPDAAGCYLAHAHCQFGHNRLKVVDLDARSDQPFHSADGRFVIIYNGEIYNYRELRKQYDLPAETESDTEVLVELYARFGPRMLDWLNGMFAFVILDKETGSLFAARDRLGVKPLYMLRKDQAISFASEISSLLSLTGPLPFDPIGLRQYLKLRACFNNRTIYSGIEMFPAGHYMLDGSLHCYWTLPTDPREPPDDEELKELISSAVLLRKVADVPVGSYLSGGIDSTLVAYLSNKPHTWTIGFAESNEFDWARIAADDIKSIHTEVIIRPEEFAPVAEFLCRKRLEPLSVPNEVLLYLMTKQVKKHNTVILSGEGADELFFGYDRIFRWASENSWDLATFSKLYSYGSHDDLEIVEDAVAPFLHLNKSIDIVGAFMQVAHLHGLLRRLDFATMLCAVEARVPFVDYRLVERMAGVPFAYRMANGVVKAPLKRIFRDVLPKPIIDRPKVGFPVPLATVLPRQEGATPMDRWLRFNVMALGVPAQLINELIASPNSSVV